MAAAVATLASAVHESILWTNRPRLPDPRAAGNREGAVTGGLDWGMFRTAGTLGFSAPLVPCLSGWQSCGLARRFGYRLQAIGRRPSDTGRWPSDGGRWPSDGGRRHRGIETDVGRRGPEHRPAPCDEELRQGWLVITLPEGVTMTRSGRFTTIPQRTAQDPRCRKSSAWVTVGPARGQHGVGPLAHPRQACGCHIWACCARHEIGDSRVGAGGPASTRPGLSAVEPHAGYRPGDRASPSAPWSPRER